MGIENDPSEIKPIVTAMGHISLQRKSIYLKKKYFYIKKNRIQFLLLIKFWENLDYEAKDKRQGKKPLEYTVPHLEMSVTYRDRLHSIAFSDMGLELGTEKWEWDKIRQSQRKLNAIQT